MRLHDYLTAREVALRLGVTASTVTRWARAGILPQAFNLFRSPRWSAESINKFVLDRQQELREESY